MAVLLVLGVRAGVAHAQTGEDALRFSQRYPATGARMLGMAGAGVAGIADVSSMFTNPAGLGYLNRSVIGGSLNALSTTDDTRFQTIGATSLDSRDLRNTRLGDFAYLYKTPTTRGSLVVGLTYNQVSTFGRNLAFDGPNGVNSLSQSFLPFDDEFEVQQDDQGYFPVFFNSVPELAYRAGAIEFLFENVDNGGPLFDPAVAFGTTVTQQGEVLEEGRMNEVNFGGAIEAARDVMIGLSANLHFGSYQFSNDYQEIDAGGQNGDYVVINGDSQLEGFDRLIYSTGFTSDLVGFSLTGGFSTRVTPEAKIGVSFETPTYYSINEDFFSDLETVFNVGGSLQASDDGQFDYELHTPWRFSGGVAYDYSGLLLSADAEYVDWSQMSFNSSTDDFADVNRNIRTMLDPVVNARIGAEYRINQIALRAGYAFRPDPRKQDITFDAGSTNRDRTFFSAGASFFAGDQLAVDFGWMQERFDDLYVPYSDVETTPPAVEETVRRNRFAVGVRVFF